MVLNIKATVNKMFLKGKDHLFTHLAKWLVAIGSNPIF